MSLVIHTIVPDGLVVSGDTFSIWGSKRYSETSEKVYPFHNRIVMTSTGEANIKDDLYDIQLVAILLKKYNNTLTINELPIRFWNEYLKTCDNIIENETTFLISGYDKDYEKKIRTFKIETKEKTIELLHPPLSYGTSFSGCTNIAEKMLKGVDFEKLSVIDAIELNESTISATITSYKYRKQPSVGGEIMTYVIDIKNNKEGWWKNGEIVPISDLC